MENRFDLLMFNGDSGGKKTQVSGTRQEWVRVNRSNRTNSTNRSNRRKKENPNQMSLF